MPSKIGDMLDVLYRINSFVISLNVFLIWIWEKCSIFHSNWREANLCTKQFIFKVSNEHVHCMGVVSSSSRGSVNVVILNSKNKKNFVCKPKFSYNLDLKVWKLIGAYSNILMEYIKKWRNRSENWKSLHYFAVVNSYIKKYIYSFTNFIHTFLHFYTQTISFNKFNLFSLSNGRKYLHIHSIDLSIHPFSCLFIYYFLVKNPEGKKFVIK